MPASPKVEHQLGVSQIGNPAPAKKVGFQRVSLGTSPKSLVGADSDEAPIGRDLNNNKNDLVPRHAYCPGQTVEAKRSGSFRVLHLGVVSENAADGDYPSLFHSSGLSCSTRNSLYMVVVGKHFTCLLLVV